MIVAVAASSLYLAGFVGFGRKFSQWISRACVRNNEETGSRTNTTWEPAGNFLDAACLVIVALLWPPVVAVLSLRKMVRFLGWALSR